MLESRINYGDLKREKKKKKHSEQVSSGAKFLIPAHRGQRQGESLPAWCTKNRNPVLKKTKQNIKKKFKS